MSAISPGQKQRQEGRQNRHLLIALLFIVSCCPVTSAHPDSTSENHHTSPWHTKRLLLTTAPVRNYLPNPAYQITSDAPRPCHITTSRAPALSKQNAISPMAAKAYPSKCSVCQPSPSFDSAGSWHRHEAGKKHKNALLAAASNRLAAKSHSQQRQPPAQRIAPVSSIPALSLLAAASRNLLSERTLTYILTLRTEHSSTAQSDEAWASELLADSVLFRAVLLEARENLYRDLDPHDPHSRQLLLEVLTHHIRKCIPSYNKFACCVLAGHLISHTPGNAVTVHHTFTRLFDLDLAFRILLEHAQEELQWTLLDFVPPHLRPPRRRSAPAILSLSFLFPPPTSSRHAASTENKTSLDPPRLLSQLENNNEQLAGAPTSVSLSPLSPAQHAHPIDVVRPGPTPLLSQLENNNEQAVGASANTTSVSSRSHSACTTSSVASHSASYHHSVTSHCPAHMPKSLLQLTRDMQVQMSFDPSLSSDADFDVHNDVDERGDDVEDEDLDIDEY